MSLGARHYCPNCRARLTPYSQNEIVTEAPEPGRSGRSVLVQSFNQTLARHDPDGGRLCWCFTCDEWVTTIQRSAIDVRLDYLRRQGISYRFTTRGSEQAQSRELELRIEERRGVVPRLAPRRRAS